MRWKRFHLFSQQTVHADLLELVSFTSDAINVLTASTYHRGNLWCTKSGDRVRTFRGHDAARTDVGSVGVLTSDQVSQCIVYVRPEIPSLCRRVPSGFLWASLGIP